MKPFVIVLQFAACWLLYKFDQVKSQNNRLWMEIDKELFLVEPEGKYTWKQAAAECKRSHSNLIEPKGDYDYANLKDAIKYNFENYASFWTNSQVKRTNVFHQIGLGREKHNRQKCNKFDNSSSFKFAPDNCDNEFGFICEKPLLQGYSAFNTNNRVYFVQPQQEFTCSEAYDQCEQRQMSMVVLKDHAHNKLLKDYVFFTYGSSVSFWFGYNNETHYNCATPLRGQQLNNNSKFGFICEKTLTKSHGLSRRHMILLIFVAIAAFLAAVVFIILKCFCSRKGESFSLPEAYFSEEIKI